MGNMYVDSRGNLRKNIPYITIAIVAMNVIIFFVAGLGGSMTDGDYLYRCGAMYWPALTEGGEYYRILTSMFLHFGMEHLINNMFMLAILGYQIEREYGSIKYFITYMLSGVFGTLFSALIEMKLDEYSISVGASGAIFGIFGAMLVMMFKNRKKSGQNSGVGLLILFVLAVFGNMQEGVDWLAHLGGAIAGVLVAFILYHKKYDRGEFRPVA